MIKTKKDLKFYLMEDKKQYNLPSYWRLGLILGYEKCHIWRYVRCLRLYEYALNNSGGITGKIRLIFRKIRFSQLKLKTGVMVLPNTIGYGFRILHMTGGIMISCKSAGNYLTVSGGVVVGQRDSIENIPTLGENVNLAVGCKIIGKLKIGNNVMVAPNSFVFRNVPDNCTVVGVPSKKIM